MVIVALRVMIHVIPVESGGLTVAKIPWNHLSWSTNVLTGVVVVRTAAVIIAAKPALKMVGIIH